MTVGVSGGGAGSVIAAAVILCAIALLSLFGVARTWNGDLRSGSFRWVLEELLGRRVGRAMYRAIVGFVIFGWVLTFLVCVSVAGAEGWISNRAQERLYAIGTGAFVLSLFLVVSLLFAQRPSSLVPPRLRPHGRVRRGSKAS
jgi:ABC-type transport system involved in cytochrome c biogenesis permease component